MEHKTEKEPAPVVMPIYKPLEPPYEPVEPPRKRKRKINRIKR